MQIIKRIFKELFIAILFLFLILAILTIAFYDKVPYAKDIPKSVKYAGIDKADFGVSDENIEDMTNPTLTYKTTAKNIQYMDTEKIVSPGKIGIFSPSTGASDIPTEKVSASPLASDNDLLTTESVSDTNTGSESGPKDVEP